VCGLVAGVLEAVHPAPRNHHGRARPRDDPLEAEAEGHRAADDLEALLLLGVRVRPRHGAAGREHQLEAEQLAVGVGRGLAEEDLLAADGVLEDLPCMRHLVFSLVRGSRWRQPTVGPRPRRQPR
jgi:hypothetical protein